VFITADITLAENEKFCGRHKQTCVIHHEDETMNMRRIWQAFSIQKGPERKELITQWYDHI
jgi:hypothetical protein